MPLLVLALLIPGVALATVEWAYLTTFCPAALDQAFKGINIDPGNIDQIYGLGQQFMRLGDANGDMYCSKGLR